MCAFDPEDVTGWLRAWSAGDSAALDRLVPIVHEELRRLAHHFMRGEAPGHTLQTTALVNEAYLRLIDAQAIHWRDRAHFLAISAKLMRQILVDVARAKGSQKRGRGLRQVCFEEAVNLCGTADVDLLALHEALGRLSTLDDRKGRVVEMRFFGGLTTREIAAVLGVSPNTVLADWSFAKAWLCREMRTE
jgi:RNA polymerase sigma factor (TIGR02999 family)